MNLKEKYSEVQNYILQELSPGKYECRIYHDTLTVIHNKFKATWTKPEDTLNIYFNYENKIETCILEITELLRLTLINIYNIGNEQQLDKFLEITKNKEE